MPVISNLLIAFIYYHFSSVNNVLNIIISLLPQLHVHVALSTLLVDYTEYKIYNNYYDLVCDMK